jgi:UDP-N-acetylglucosamine 4,6-dehydratase
LNVKRAALSCSVKQCVLISTDKAVKPVNLYGMTKGMAERIWTNDTIGRSSTVFKIARYGNVISSRGSVVPYFKRLIKENKPLPITHPEMTRFLLTLKQAIDLVIHVTEYGKDGEIYVPNLPACKILDLARALAGEDYPYTIIGIRPGEKIHECLIQEYEITRTEKKRQLLHNPPNLNSDLFTLE